MAKYIDKDALVAEIEKSMKKFLKKLFCIHQYKYSSSKRTTRHEADFSGDGYNTWTEVLDVYVCEKCGKTKKVLR